MSSAPVSLPPGLGAFSSVLIANRGEIVERVARTARRLGLRTIGVCSWADRHAPHAQCCDQTVMLGGERPSESYLHVTNILNAARQSGAEAIHPGYGFLSENPDFAQAVIDAGLVWIGPSPASMRAMGDKANARAGMQQAGVPVLPGTPALDDLDALARLAQDMTLPLMVKAAAGGGGRGMRWVSQASELADALTAAQAEAKAAFGDGRLLIEQALLAPRHVEIQLLADAHGKVIHLGERDCSVQRRHQKLIEEAPSPSVDAALRRRMGEAAILVARCAGPQGYCGAGTVEFLLDAQGHFWFMEMNTRLQVEHPVTECLTGLDLVEWQFRVARGEHLGLDQNDVLSRFESSGHAIEVRLCAEDPEQSHLPQTGVLHRWQAPPGLRVDAALASGQVISPFYDSMLGKLIAHGRDRNEACRQLIHGLTHTICMGLVTNRAFLAHALSHPVFVAGQAHTGFIAEHMALESSPGASTKLGLLALSAVALICVPLDGKASIWQGWHASGRIERQVVIRCGGQNQIWAVMGHGRNWRVSQGEQTWTVNGFQADPSGRLTACIDDSPLVGHWHRVGQAFWLQSGLCTVQGEDASLEPASRHAALAQGSLVSPMHGRVVRVEVNEGDRVEQGDVVLVLEAMKMEHRLQAPRSGQVRQLQVAVGAQVAARQVLAQIEA